MILTSLQKLANNVGILGKIIVGTGFKWLYKVQNIAQSGHTDPKTNFLNQICGPTTIVCNYPLLLIICCLRLPDSCSNN